MELSGRRVLLTGATGGLGHSIAEELSRSGANLVLSGRRRQLLEPLAERLDAEVIVADLADPDDLGRVAGAARGVDVLVANAGVGGDRPVTEMASTDIDEQIDVNLRAPIVAATELVRARLADGRPGHVVFVGSLSSLAPLPRSRMYNATKFGIRGFALALRQDLHGTSVGASIVEPGFISDAGMFVDSGTQLPPGIRTRSPADVAVAVVQAIERDRGEVFVAPLELRAWATLATVAPGLSAAALRRSGAAARKGDVRPLGGG